MRTLLIEDNPADARLICEMLKEASEPLCQQAGRLDAGLAKLDHDTFDVVLLDLSLPDSHGMQTLTHAQQTHRGMPIVILTGLDDQTFAVEAIRAGAQDYLVKGRFDSDLLVRTMRHAVERKHFEEELRLSHERWEFAVNSIQAGVWDLDLVNYSATRSERHDAIFGYTQMLPDWTYEMLLEHVVESDRPRVNRTFLDAVLDRKPWKSEARIRRADGQLRWIRISGEHFTNHLGHPNLLGLIEDITDRRQSEEAIRTERQRLNNVLEMLPAYVVLLTPDYRIAFANRFFREVFGDSLGKRCYEYLFHRDSPCEICETFTPFKTKAPHNWEWTGPDGHSYDVYDFPFSDINGSPLIMEMGLDVTQRKQAEAQIRKLTGELEERVERRTMELAESEKRFHTIYDTAPVSIWQEDWSDVIPIVRQLQSEGVTDFEAYALEHPEFTFRMLKTVKVVDVNQWTLSLFKARDKQHLLDSFDTIFAMPESQSVFLACLNALARGEPIYRSELPINTADGQKICGLLTLSLPMAGSASANVLASVNDITDRKRAEDALRTSEERFKAIAANTPDHVIVQDSELRYTLVVNPQLGLTQQEMLGKTDHDLVSKQEADHLTEFKHRAIETRQPVQVQIPLTSRSGEAKVFEGSYIPRFDSQGNVDAIIGYFRDVTEQKVAEEEIRNLNEKLRQRAVLLEAANKELEAFAYSVSHDLRAPLRSIDGFSRILLRDCADKLDNSNRDALQRVRANSIRMGQLIDDLLDLSRITRDQMRCAPVDLSALAEAVCEALRKNNPDRIAKFFVQPGITAHGDARLLHIALENLMSNALKFTGKLQMAKIEFGCVETESGPACFVRDNGAGFDMQYAGKLFTPFRRLHTSEEFPGTGIGLATVQRVIRRHGGRVWAEGKQGEGATFYFSLPSQSTDS